MKLRRIFQANHKTAEERAHEQALRDKLQKERPSLEDLIRNGECDPEAVITMGTYFALHRALRALKRTRNQYRRI